jgi:ribosome-associated protein
MTISKPSKSAKKREFLALQKLGEELIGLSEEQLTSVGLDEGLLDAIVTAKSISSHGAMRRQKQLIGKLMRHVDAEPIRATLLTFGKSDQMQKEVFRKAERWRDRIVSEGSAAAAEFTDELGVPAADVTALTAALITAPNDRARRELQRKLFRELHRNLALKMQDDTD